MEDAHARHLLLHSQHLSWGVQALAHLAAASLKRDVYGVVQKDLPAIIKTLVQLKSALERLPLHSHKRTMRPGTLEIRMKAALTSAVKRSLYILCNAFGPYLSDLPLSEDLRQVLGNYILYKEG
ncbi:nucleoporin Ndc1-like [Frankliniella occidentalis]|nr:nucleoporin Ndc1-like [Frankliniella occidentalis]